MAGSPAFVSGTQLKPVIDWEMGENDEEAEVRPDQRQLAINGRHPLFRAADRLTGTRQRRVKRSRICARLPRSACTS